MNQKNQKRRGMAPAGLRAVALGAFLLTIAACGGDSPPPSGPHLPPHVSAALKDPRIGQGVPAAFRMTGVEHNRLTLLTLQALRPEARGFRDAARRCTAIHRILAAQAPHTAAAAGIPGRVAEVRGAIASATQDLPGCKSTRPVHIVADGTGASVGGQGNEAYISDNAFVVMDGMLAGINGATSVEGVVSAIGQAALAAASLPELDAAAVYAIVAQAQGSVVLWDASGPGWIELGMTGGYQNVLRTRGRARIRESGTVDGLVAMASADVGGCLASMQALRQFPIIGNDAGLLMAACAGGAAAGTVFAAYKLAVAYE